MKKFRIYSDDFGGENTNAIPQSENVYTRDLVASTEVTITVPSGSKFATFQANVDKLWIALSESAITVPTGSLDDQTIMLNPDIRYVAGNPTVRAISANSGQLVVSFYG